MRTARAEASAGPRLLPMIYSSENLLVRIVRLLSAPVTPFSARGRNASGWKPSKRAQIFFKGSSFSLPVHISQANP